MKNIIRRSFDSTHCDMLVFNHDTKAIETVPGILPGKVDAEKAVKLASKLYPALHIVCVENLEPVSGLYGMDEETFTIYAKAYESREKEIRGYISKTIKVHTAHILVMTPDRQVKDIWYTGVSDEKTARRVCKDEGIFIQLVDVAVHEVLYAMPVDQFMELAKPMIDNFHFAK